MMQKERHTIVKFTTLCVSVIGLHQQSIVVKVSKNVWKKTYVSAVLALTLRKHLFCRKEAAPHAKQEE